MAKTEVFLQSQRLKPLPGLNLFIQQRRKDIQVSAM